MEIFKILLIQPLANGLILFYRLLGGNLGLSIIAFSIFLRTILNPLTKPYMESMKKMKDFEPQLTKLKKKYKDDKTKLMKAQADFYKEKGINPSSGCLPYLFQIVILIALFNVFSTILKVNGQSTFNNLLYQPLKFSEGESLSTKFLYVDLTKPDVFNLPGVPFPVPGPIIILSAIAQLLSAKITAPVISAEKKIAKKTPGEADDVSVAMQQSMTYTFPLFTLFIGMSFASGLTLYWFVFSAVQAYQQYRYSGWGGLTPWVNKLTHLVSSSKV